MLVIDAMTFDGFVNSVNRHGMARTRATPIQRASFQEALDVLIEACTFGTRVEVKGVTECVVMGAPSSIGSGHGAILSETTASKKLQRIIYVTVRWKKTTDTSNQRTAVKIGVNKT